MFKFLLSGKGRVSRKDYFLKWVVPYVLLMLASGFVDRAIFPDITLEMDGDGPIRIIFYLLALWPQVAIAAKRFHDRGRSGWTVAWLFGATFVGSVVPAVAEVFLAPESTAAVAAHFAGLALVAIAALFAFLQLVCLPGQEGENRYGPDPRQQEA